MSKNNINICISKSPKQFMRKKQPWQCSWSILICASTRRAVDQLWGSLDGVTQEQDEKTACVDDSGTWLIGNPPNLCFSCARRRSTNCCYSRSKPLIWFTIRKLPNFISSFDCSSEDCTVRRAVKNGKKKKASDRELTKLAQHKKQLHQFHKKQESIQNSKLKSLTRSRTH